VFQAAAEAGMAVRAVGFPEGAYLDVGKAESIASLLLSEDPG
jgi:hypothetical protein